MKCKVLQVKGEEQKQREDRNETEDEHESRELREKHGKEGMSGFVAEEKVCSKVRASNFSFLFK